MDGILLVDKPQRLTSHDVVDIIRKRFGLKKAGHAGTLDPMATGLLIVLVGAYTKRSASFLNDDKEYEGTMTLGAVSDTQDAWGAITDLRGHYGPDGLDERKIRSAFAKFVGSIEQDVPAYSAKKVNGRKMYELARKGVDVKVEPKRVNIHSLQISGIELPRVHFKVRCSKGTYVRQLCSDIGEVLGCGAYLSCLRRTGSGNYSVKDAITMEELNRIDRAALEKWLKTQ